MTSTYADDERRPPWRRRAATVVVFAVVAALVIFGVAAAVVWTWQDELPSPIASHWDAGSEPDGFSSPTSFVLVMAAMVALGCLVFGAIGWFWGSSAVTRRLVAASCVWIGGFGAAVLLIDLGVQRGSADAREVTLPGWALALTVLIPLLPAAVAAVLVPADPRQPATAPVAADAERITLTEDERAVWIRRADGGPGLAIGAVAVVGTALLAIGTAQWGLLVVPVLLAVLLVTMFVFTVRVDAAGLTVRSAVGWPRTFIPADEVERASSTRVRPLREFGGWGWRVRGGGGRVGVVLRAGEGLLVQRTGGRSFVITVDGSADGAALLNTLADRARSTGRPAG